MLGLDERLDQNRGYSIKDIVRHAMTMFMVMFLV